MSNETDKSSPLFELPAEVRLRIYEMIYQDQVHIFNVAESVHWIMRLKPLDKQKNDLLRTCHTIYEEALPVMYQKIQAQIMLFPIDKDHDTNDLIACGPASEFDYFKYVQNIKLWLGEGQSNEDLGRELEMLPTILRFLNSSNRIKHLTIVLQCSQFTQQGTVDDVFKALMDLRVDRRTAFKLVWKNGFWSYGEVDYETGLSKEDGFKSVHYHALMKRLKT